jgi:response regulator RpfG family c-di-GMP phosphodiesterase
MFSYSWSKGDESEVFENIRGEAGKQLDPEPVEIFLESIDTFRQIGKLYPDHAEQPLIA